MLVMVLLVDFLVNKICLMHCLGCKLYTIVLIVRHQGAERKCHKDYRHLMRLQHRQQ